MYSQIVVDAQAGAYAMVSDLDRAVLVVVSPGYESWFRRAGAASAIMLVLGPGEQRMRKYCSAFSLCLLAPGAAWADGGIGALGGVLDMFLLMTGAGGLFIVLLMFAIIGAQKDQPRDQHWHKDWHRVFCCLRLPGSILFRGIVRVAVLAGSCVHRRRHHRVAYRLHVPP